eukprot:4216746-Ditylum_brightwellii.AAC.1
MAYQCCKYCHSPKNHDTALASLISYNFYQECTEGLALEMCTHKPLDRSRHEKRGSPKKDGIRNEIAVEKLKRAQHTKYHPGRLRGDLERFCSHVISKYNANNAKPCDVCGIDSYTTRGLCKVHVHYFPQKGGQKGHDCFLEYHNKYFFGLARKDTTLVKKTPTGKQLLQM